MAYYTLLMTQAMYKSYHTISSDSLINISVDYYKQSGDKNEYARSLLYRGNVRYDLGLIKEAMEDYKMAEDVGRDVSDNLLRHNILFQIANLNLDNSEYQLALENYKNALAYSTKDSKDDYRVYDYQNISVCFYYQAQYDSCYYYINRCAQMIDKIPNNPILNKSRIMVSLGATYFMMNDYEASKEALEAAISMIPLGSAYAVLARICLHERDTAKAKEYLYEGLKHVDSKSVEVDILKSLGHIEQQQGNHKRAAELSQQAYTLKDSLTRRHQEDNIKAQQIAFDHKVKSEQAATVRRWLWAGIILAVLVGAAAVTAVLLRWQKTRRRLAEKQQQVEKLQAEEQQVNKELGRTKNTVERLKRAQQEQDKAMNSRQREWERHGRVMERGHRLFVGLSNGGSTAKWSSDDFKDFRTYYDSVDSAFAEAIAQKYERLSPNLYILAILEHIGKSDEDIMAIMGLNLGALRTTRTRLNQKILTLKHKTTGNAG